MRKFKISKKAQITADYRITDCLDFINVSKMPQMSHNPKSEAQEECFNAAEFH